MRFRQRFRQKTDMCSRHPLARGHTLLPGTPPCQGTHPLARAHPLARGQACVSPGNRHAFHPPLPPSSSPLPLPPSDRRQAGVPSLLKRELRQKTGRCFIPPQEGTEDGRVADPRRVVDPHRRVSNPPEGTDRGQACGRDQRHRPVRSGPTGDRHVARDRRVADPPEFPRHLRLKWHRPDRSER